MTDNPIRYKAGNMTRCLKMLDYLEKNANTFDVEFLSMEEWDDNERAIFQSKYPSIKLQTFFLKYPKKTGYLNYFILDKLPFLLSTLFRNKGNLSKVTPYIKKQLKRIYQGKRYDVLIVSYAEWAEFIDFIPAAYTINDTHDFLTIQRKKWGDIGFSHLGSLFASELKALARFDEVWTYSSEEHYIFDQCLTNQVELYPISFPYKIPNSVIPKDIDVLYVASANPHNVSSMNWFIAEVLPKLQGLKVTLIGKICEFIDDHPQLVKLGRVEDLDSYYWRSKISICPMVSGTGIKIKVVESLSYGVPVVTSRRGVDGLVNKENNGCLVDDTAIGFAANIRRLLEDQELHDRVRREGIKFFMEHHAPEREMNFLNTRLLKH